MMRYLLGFPPVHLVQVFLATASGIILVCYFLGLVTTRKASERTIPWWVGWSATIAGILGTRCFVSVSLGLALASCVLCGYGMGCARSRR